MPFIVIILFIVLADFVVWKGICMLHPKFAESSLRTLKRVHWFISGIFVLAIALGGLFKLEARNSYQLLAFYRVFAIFLIIYLPKFTFALWTVLVYGGSVFVRKISWDNPSGRECHPVTLMKVGLLFSLLPLTGVLLGMKYGKSDFEIRVHTLPLQGLPEAFDGLRIVHISDLHLGSWGKDTLALQEAVSMIRSLHADVLVCTGDLVNNFQEEALPYLSLFRGLHFPEGKYFVSGNHDYGDYARATLSGTPRRRNRDQLIKHIHSMGFSRLDNTSGILRRGNAVLGLAGTGYYNRKPEKQYANLGKALQGTDSLSCILLFSHNPELFQDLVTDHPSIRLTLSGHTHGGQIGLPLGKKIISPIALRYKYWDGLYQNPSGQFLYVNRGLGFLGFPGRMGIPPEITLLILKPE